MDNLKVVRELRDLAAVPQNRATIVRDRGCLPGLVLFLDNSNQEVVATALEALHYLAQTHSNRSIMKNEVGLVISLRSIMERSDYDPNVVQLADSIHRLLIPPAGAVTRPLAQARGGAAARSGSNTFLGASNRKARTIVLQVSGLVDQETRSIVEDSLLTVKGVVSFTIDIGRQRCTVRLRSDLKPELLCEAINGTGILLAQQVVKNELGEEVLLSFGSTPQAHVQDEKENSRPMRLPEYLPEEDQLDEDKAIEKSGAVGEGGGWLSSVTGFIGKAFYW
ncbi:PREDICTED: armadillo repeat-containing protein 1-like [Amphimedon queenslandica]|uniref:Armadillo repeat-containing protein 1 n=1 Tax=Amphimedon queenslandica TaxID=400682 RepID=A0A1X7UU08_AMPQE|nr:PREDICTED: armadillo repeat-containing protein 1-like [Amphimedon queenslandica]XP_019852521.1 PREDICTED: armadillo repeat-containing protein 1-like [Amphimedon queenslandica]|eukprot:XP_003386895.1 PREDICTED: armadillo repeat-containing protein 1-like [Amphimedon queenslandica]